MLQALLNFFGMTQSATVACLVVFLVGAVASGAADAVFIIQEYKRRKREKTTVLNEDFECKAYQPTIVNKHLQLSVENLSVGYEGNAVCENISFEVNAGDYMCIIGENGAGKSTLMKTLLGLVPPISGKIVKGEGISGIGYLPQQDTSQSNFPASVWEIVLSGCLSKSGLRPFYNKAEKALALEKMQILGIEKLKRKSFAELSGGQQQKVLLARVLCATDKIMLLDEPITGLDPQATQDLYLTIKKLNEECGTTILMITHDLNSIKYANKVLRIKHGESVFKTGEEFLNSKDALNEVLDV